MFATLHGGYPAPEPGADLDAAVGAVLEAQALAGLGLLTDGDLRIPAPFEVVAELLAGAVPPGRFARAWKSTADMAGDALPVKARLPGPFSASRRLAGADQARLGTVLRTELEALVEAGCPFVQVDEDDAAAIATPADRAAFRAAHLALLEGIAGLDAPHLSLAISGGDATSAGPETIFAAPYASHFFDLCAGPDNWYLIRRAPALRGMVLGVEDARREVPDALETTVWAVFYAATSGETGVGERGLARVGIAPSGSLGHLSPEVARRKIERLGEAARIVAERDSVPIAGRLDPRSVDLRSAGLGRWTPPADRPAGRSRRRPGSGRTKGSGPGG
jgi:hypothetical protein